MPTVLRIGQYRFFFYSKEGNEPPHIHVKAGGCEAKVWLTDLSFAKNSRFKSHELNEISKHVTDNALRFRADWERYFGARSHD